MAQILGKRPSFSRIEKEMKRGTIIWVALGDTYPPEMGKTRPAVIISNTEQNEILSTLVVIPLSSQAPEIWPLRVKLKVRSKLKTSYAVIPGIRQVSKSRLTHEIGLLSESEIAKLKEALDLYLMD